MMLVNMSIVAVLHNASFSRNWQLSEDTIVDGVSYMDGLLRVTLRKFLQDKLKSYLSLDIHQFPLYYTEVVNPYLNEQWQ